MLFMLSHEWFQTLTDRDVIQVFEDVISKEA